MNGQAHVAHRAVGEDRPGERVAFVEDVPVRADRGVVVGVDLDAYEVPLGIEEHFIEPVFHLCELHRERACGARRIRALGRITERPTLRNRCVRDGRQQHQARRDAGEKRAEDLEPAHHGPPFLLRFVFWLSRPRAIGGASRRYRWP